MPLKFFLLFFPPSSCKNNFIKGGVFPMWTVKLHASVKLFAMGHLIFLGTSFICSSLKNTSVQILSSRLCFLLWVASVPRSGLRCFIKVYRGAGEFRNGRATRGGVMQPPGASCIPTAVWVWALTWQTNGCPSRLLWKSAWLRPPFRFPSGAKWRCQTQLCRQRPLSPQIWVAVATGAGKTPTSAQMLFFHKRKFPILNLCLFPVAYLSCLPSSAGAGAPLLGVCVCFEL